jgi:hypothetical protein
MEKMNLQDRIDKVAACAELLGKAAEGLHWRSEGGTLFLTDGDETIALGAVEIFTNFGKAAFLCYLIGGARLREFAGQAVAQHGTDCATH